MYYKVLEPNGCPAHGGTGQWSLPVLRSDGGYEPGEWMPEITDLVPCERGYHLCRPEHLVYWLGPCIYEAEAGGEIVDLDDKLCCGRARLLRPLTTWDARAARLFAADCAERVLPIFEAAYPDDPRPRHALQVARRYARGEASDGELARARTAIWAARAAGKASWTAPWSESWAAAEATTWAAISAATCAQRAVWAAAAASESLAEQVGAGDAERTWQTARLLDYLEGRC